MTFLRNGIDGKTIGAQTYLEFSVHLLELNYFNPIVFCHDKSEFSKKRYAQVIASFLDLLSFLDSCGIILTVNLKEESDVENELFSNIIDSTNSIGIVSYELQEADFTNMNIFGATVPQHCVDDDFSLVKIYLLMRTGSSLTKRSFEQVMKRKLGDSDVQTLRKQLAAATGRIVEKRVDNSYEMR